MYKEIWEAAVGEELVCAREPHNSHDRYAVAVKREGVLIGHLPRKLHVSRLCSLFLRRGGAIFCVVTVLTNFVSMILPSCIGRVS